MAIGVILHDIFNMVRSSTCQSWVKIKRSQWFLIVQECFGLLPGTPPLDGLVVNFALQFHVDFVDERAQLFLDEPNIVFGIFASEVDVPEDFLCLQGHSFRRNGI